MSFAPCVAELVEIIRSGVEPAFTHTAVLLNRDQPAWLGNDCLLEIPAKNIHFTKTNRWNLHHAAALYEHIRNGEILWLYPPVARVYRSGLHYRALLLDGHHRALAALAAGASAVTVIDGEI